MNAIDPAAWERLRTICPEARMADATGTFEIGIWGTHLADEGSDEEIAAVVGNEARFYGEIVDVIAAWRTAPIAGRGVVRVRIRMPLSTEEPA